MNDGKMPWSIHPPYGYLTTKDARELGINPLRLQDLVRRGLAKRVAQGLYRLTQVPPTALDQYMEATLWPRGVRGVLSHETALDLHGLCDVNPAKVHLTVPATYRPRRDVPVVYLVHRRDLDPGDVTRHEGIPIVTPYRAILDGIEGHLGPRLLDQAIENAIGRGLLTREERANVEGRLQAPAPV
jgi:predicted transcriptional regulator of viral defense system